MARDCNWVANRKTVERCEIDGMSEACRVTCDNCDSEDDDFEDDDPEEEEEEEEEDGSIFV